MLTASWFQDKSSNVRKAAVQLLTTLLESNPFAAKLGTMDLEIKLKEEELKLKEMTPDDQEEIDPVQEWNNIKEAVCAPRFHSQWLPDVIQIEPRGLSEDVLSNIKLRGHKVIYRGGYIGESNGIMITNEGLFGGGDCRGETSAIGY